MARRTPEQIFDLVIQATDPDRSSAEQKDALKKIAALVDEQRRAAESVISTMAGKGRPPTLQDVEEALSGSAEFDQRVAEREAERDAARRSATRNRVVEEHPAAIDALRQMDPNDPGTQAMVQALDMDPTNDADIAAIWGDFDTMATVQTGMVPIHISTVQTPRLTGNREMESGSGINIDVAPVEVVYNQINSLQGDELRDMQLKLYRAGFYGDTVRFDDIKWGDPDDPATKQAWGAAVNAAADRHSGGRSVTVEQLLDQRVAQGFGRGEDEDEAGGELVTLSNPQSLSSRLDKIAESVLGRRANEAEKRMFVELVHGMEQQFASQSAALATSGGTVTGVPDVNTAAEGFLRNQDPEDAQQMDVAGSYRNFLGMLGAGGTGAA